jgi:hypothetical protein
MQYSSILQVIEGPSPIFAPVLQATRPSCIYTSGSCCTDVPTLKCTNNNVHYSYRYEYIPHALVATKSPHLHPFQDTSQCQHYKIILPLTMKLTRILYCASEGQK